MGFRDSPWSTAASFNPQKRPRNVSQRVTTAAANSLTLFGTEYLRTAPLSPPSLPIHFPFQSSGFSGPLEHRAVVLQADAMPP